MCVNAKRSALFSRASFLAAAGAAAAPLLLEPAAASAAVPALAIPDGLSAGNAHAAQLAQTSPLIRSRYAQALSLAKSIGDAKVRADVVDLLQRPLPQYALKYRTDAERTALRDALAREGFVKPDAPVSGIFPSGTAGTRVVQPFWSAPGSDLDSHHSYPGGLLMHELFNANMAANFERTYDALYFDGASAVNRDTVVGAQFYHDIMKVVVFQFNADGTLTPELTIADTGGHHCLSGAEAIVRGRDAKFVTVLLSAHASPSLGDEKKVVDWCRAAAMIAGVDPVEYGLVKKSGDGYVLAELPSIETFVSNLSDHDYVMTIPAVRNVAPLLHGINPSLWFRHRVLAHTSAVRLYQELATHGEAGFHKALHASGF